MGSTPYGSKAQLGIGPPQANPVVEPEIALLLPPGVSLHASRLRGTHGQSREKLVEYFSNLSDTLEGYDTFRPDVFGFACTSSSYLIDAKYERSSIESFQEKFGYPIITCCEAILDGLKQIGASSISLICPYPDWLMKESANYWDRNSVTVVETHSANPNAVDTRAVYELDANVFVQQILPLVSNTKADLILIAGTGLPSLAAIRDISRETGKVVLSSNLCLAWRLLKEAGLEPDSSGTSPKFPLLDGWQGRLERVLNKGAQYSDEK